MVSGTYTANKNKVIINDNSHRFEYEVLPEYHCQKCSFPDTDEDHCPWHSDDVMDKTLAIGIYYPLRNQRHSSSNLSNDIYEFKSNMSIGKRLGILTSIAINQIYTELQKFNYLVPVPRTEEELKVDHSSQKKFNPQLMLATEASLITRIKMIEVLTKIKPVSQHGRTRDQRKEVLNNAEQYFEVKNNSLGTGDSVILIDDVRTSGYTASACAKVLKAAGAGNVYLLVLGRDVGNGLP